MVKCRDCGLLSIRDRSTGEARPADEEARDEAHYMSQGTRYAAQFLCHANAENFPYDSSDHSTKNAVDSINLSIECRDFTTWHPTKTAREHEEMTLLQKVEEKHRTQREEDVRAADQRHRETLEWQKQVEENLDHRFSEGQKTLERQHGSGLVVKLFIALMAIAATLIAAKLLPWFN